MKTSYYKIIPILLVSFFVFSCSNKEKIKDSEFKLPANIMLTTETFFNPLFVDNIFGNPNRTAILWNNATFKKCLITKMSITKNKHSKKEIEKLIYKFDSNGFPIEFYNYNDSKIPLSKSKFFYDSEQKLDSIDVIKFLGIPSENALKVEYLSAKHINYNYTKTIDKKDQVQYFYSNNSLNLIVKRIGNTIVQVDFITEEGTPISKLKNLIKSKMSKTDELIYSEIFVTYLKNNLPAASYAINSDWAQTEKVKEWNYDKNSKLNAFKEWGNRVLIKDLFFHYSENGVLQSVNFNKDEFSFEYNK
jgi:hypothetical protein